MDSKVDFSMLGKGNYDTYFKVEAFVHGITSFLALCYYLFGHGPRSTSAPLSVFFDKICYSKAKKPEIPVVPTLGKKNDDWPTIKIATSSSNFEAQVVGEETGFDENSCEEYMTAVEKVRFSHLNTGTISML